MDVWKRFNAHRTTEVEVLLTATSRLNVLSQLVHKFAQKVNDIDEFTEPIIETMHTVLCLVWQKVAPSNCHLLELDNDFFVETRSIMRTVNVLELQSALYTQKFSAKTSSLLLDILVLCVAMYSSTDDIDSNSDMLVQNMESHLDDDSMTSLDIKMMNCYLDGLSLHLEGFEDRKDDRMLSRVFIRNIASWFKLGERGKRLLLTIVLPKVLKMTSADNEILGMIWRYIFLEDDSTNALGTLCLAADIYFPTHTDYNQQLMYQTVDESLWLLILKGLSSPTPQYRKEALYLIKRIVDFTDKHNNQGLKLDGFKKIRPLLCIGNAAQQNLFKKNLNNYILTLEALEEKQKHLVTPVFPILKTLLDETENQENCQTGLHIAWICCAFGQILRHDNNAIVRRGLQNVLALDPKLYDDEFLSKVLEVLNQTWLYKCESSSEEPIVVKELIELLDTAEAKNSDLVTRFIIKASQMTWGPVALFYVIHALSMVKKTSGTWKENELEAVKSIAEINLTMHCKILRIGSQIELLETMTHFATEPLDLVAVANTLSAFSTGEALIRGQLAWKRTATWLSKIIKHDEALSFLENVCGQMFNHNSRMDLNMRVFSLMIMLLYDGHVILNSQSCPGLKTLRTLLHCLIRADSRPYGNAELRVSSIELLYNLMDMTSLKDCVLRELISDYADASLQYVFKSLRKISDTDPVDNINTHLLLTQQLFTAENSIISKRELLNHIERFEIESWNIIEDGEDSHSMQRLFGIKILYACLKATSTNLKNYKFIAPLYNTYKIPIKQSSRSTETNNGSRNMNGKIATEYYKYIAKLFYEYVRDESVDDWIAEIDWLEQASYLIEVGGKDIFKPVVGILSQILYKEAVKPTDIDRFKSTMKLCYNAMLDSNECRSASEDLMYLIFSSPFLERKETREFTVQCTREMVDKADKIPELIIILLKGLERMKKEYFSDFYEVIPVCLIYGTVPRRDQRIELQAQSYILDCYQEVYPNYLTNMNVNTSAATRAFAVSLLHKMISDDPACTVQFLPLVVSKLNENQNKRYFGDSQMHRSKNRIMQVLILLQPILGNTDIESLHSLMCNNVLSESSQPSIRMMQEWLLIRIYLESETLRSKIWDLFSQGNEKRVGSLCSVLSIVYHVARLLPSDLQPDFMNQALQCILPCCMAQQFNVRLYAQVIALKLYTLASELSYSTIIEKYREVYSALTESLKHGNLMKNSIKLLDDFYFTVFNPIADYSLQTIFYDLPRLSNVSSDELISAQVFEKFGFKESNSHPLKLLNPNSDMSEAQVSEHILKSSGSAGPVADEMDCSNDCSSDMQKKFIPWKSMTPNEDFLDEMSETLASRRKALLEEDNIILVASLIEKPPNLGGLSRTCEILGVKEFVVASIKQTEDKGFQSLSVSAEKLITLTEVKPHQLQEYLLEKRDAGYRLVGAEQTVNSINLIDMKFNNRTVLVLGNEKTGIPANILPLLDQCVEIPQVGVVRSLNVHVTGAICLWEYFKQHRLT